MSLDRQEVSAEELNKAQICGAHNSPMTCAGAGKLPECGQPILASGHKSLGRRRLRMVRIALGNALTSDQNSDPNIKAFKRRGFIHHGSTFSGSGGLGFC